VTGSGGSYSIAATHQYAEEGTYTVSIAVADDGGSSTSLGTTATVNDAALTAGTASATTSTEGVSSSSLSATFTDANTGALPSDFTATINWGDSTAATTGAVTGSGGSYSIAATHQYAEEGTYTVSIAVADDGGSSTSLGTTATVSDPAVVGTGGFVVTAVEGKPSATQTVATFTDPGGAEAIGNYSASIDWGDGTAQSAGVITLASGVYTVQGNHTYADEGAYTVRVHLVHESASATDVTSSAVVADNIPVLSCELHQGKNKHDVTLTGTYTDTAVEGHTLLISWGDGSFNIINLGVASSGSFTQTHHYHGNGGGLVESGGHTFTIVVTVLDDEGTSSAPVVLVVNFNGGHGNGNTSPSAFTIKGPSDSVQSQTQIYELQFRSFLPLLSQPGVSFIVSWGASSGTDTLQGGGTAYDPNALALDAVMDAWDVDEGYLWLSPG
jgi:PKD repeat protein